ncbi:hypothetical protein N7520_010782 [Penicillium odoratum]|uniref:uncharacterized protein n=1 Tax=Penicillium odoratum TaxID=1167516 RepID=UPI0025477DF4|nr:uncharacterized protein N7520_010782 [Penicillium odoratum]KAJ5745600.1 hypothetical protein N7520_010782 [Penicillium odoratum]
MPHSNSEDPPSPLQQRPEVYLTEEEKTHLLKITKDISFTVDNAQAMLFMAERALKAIEELLEGRDPIPDSQSQMMFSHARELIDDAYAVLSDIPRG